jgi:hypothetical protein
MPGTVTDDIEIIVTGHGGGGGNVPAGGDDDGGDGGSGLPAIPQRAYYTALQVGLAGMPQLPVLAVHRCSVSCCCWRAEKLSNWPAKIRKKGMRKVFATGGA